jgi:hypothetical protein
MHALRRERRVRRQLRGVLLVQRLRASHPPQPVWATCAPQAAYRASLSPTINRAPSTSCAVAVVSTAISGAVSVPEAPC